MTMNPQSQGSQPQYDVMHDQRHNKRRQYHQYENATATAAAQ